MLKKMRTTGNYDSSKENDKEDRWKLVTRGCKPQVKQTVTIYTTNSFKPLSTNDDPETNKTMQQTTPVQQPNVVKDTKKLQRDRIRKYRQETLKRLKENEKLFFDKAITQAKDEHTTIAKENKTNVK
jgi:hypothetical protein